MKSHAIEDWEEPSGEWRPGPQSQSHFGLVFVGSRKTSTLRIASHSVGTGFPGRKSISTTLALGDYLSIRRARILSHLLFYSSSAYSHSTKARSHHKYFQTSQTIQPSHNFSSIRASHETMAPCTCTSCAACSGDCSSCGCADCGVGLPVFLILLPTSPRQMAILRDGDGSFDFSTLLEPRPALL